MRSLRDGTRVEFYSAIAVTIQLYSIRALQPYNELQTYAAFAVVLVAAGFTDVVLAEAEV